MIGLKQKVLRVGITIFYQRLERLPWRGGWVLVRWYKGAPIKGWGQCCLVGNERFGYFFELEWVLGGRDPVVRRRAKKRDDINECHQFEVGE